MNKNDLKDCLVFAEEVSFRKTGLQGYLLKLEVQKLEKDRVSEFQIAKLKK